MQSALVVFVGLLAMTQTAAANAYASDYPSETPLEYAFENQFEYTPERASDYASDLAAELESASRSEPEFEPLGGLILSIGGAAVFPLADSGNRFSVGGGFVAGAGYQFTDRLGIELNYLYSRFGVSSNLFSANNFDGSHVMQSGNLDLVVRFSSNNRFGFYFVAGPGLYYRRSSIDHFDGTTQVPFCDPWFYFCASENMPVETVLGSRSRVDFGFNLGVGGTLALFGRLHLYLEARYLFMGGPRVSTPSGSKRAIGQYIPVVLGLKF